MKFARPLDDPSPPAGHSVASIHPVFSTEGVVRTSLKEILASYDRFVGV